MRPAKRASHPVYALALAQKQPDWIKWNVFFIAIHPPRVLSISCMSLSLSPSLSNKFQF